MLFLSQGEPEQHLSSPRERPTGQKTEGVPGQQPEGAEPSAITHNEVNPEGHPCLAKPPDDLSAPADRLQLHINTEALENS